MITIVIPAHNEEKRLAPTVDAYARAFPKHDILIVPNGCTDSTEAIAKKLAKKYSCVRVWATDKAGKGLAVREGFARAKGDLVGFVDADLAIEPKEFAKLLEFAGEADVVIASRWVRGARMTELEPLQTRIAGRIFNLLVRIAFALPVRDTQCGAKIFRTQLVRQILPRCFINKMAFDVELLWRAKRQGAIIKEVPITWHHNAQDSHTGIMKTGLKMITQLASLWWRG